MKGKCLNYKLPHNKEAEGKNEDIKEIRIPSDAVSDNNNESGVL